jgi:hypothetical protein
MPNNTNRRNHPPTGEGKRQPRTTGAAKKLNTRSETLQAQRNHPELNLEERDVPVSRGAVGSAGPRRKAGR